MNPILRKAQQLDAAWTELAADVDLGGVTRADFETALTAATDAETALAEAKANTTDKQVEKQTKMFALNTLCNTVANGIRGNADYGDDSDLYKAAGFVRKSERASGNTRKHATPPPGAGS